MGYTSNACPRNYLNGSMGVGNTRRPVVRHWIVSTWRPTQGMGYKRGTDSRTSRPSSAFQLPPLQHSTSYTSSYASLERPLAPPTSYYTPPLHTTHLRLSRHSAPQPALLRLNRIALPGCDHPVFKLFSNLLNSVHHPYARARVSATSTACRLMANRPFPSARPLAAQRTQPPSPRKGPR